MSAQENSHRSSNIAAGSELYGQNPEPKSYLHRQRVGENGPEKTSTKSTPRSIMASNGTPDTPELSDSRVGIFRIPSNSSQQSSRRRAQRLSPATSLTQSKSLSQPESQITASASPSLDRVPSIDRMRDPIPVPAPRAKRKSRQGPDTVMTTQDSVKMQGQDTLEVRNVTLPDGQSASLVLEDGKLQRIVSSSGNVVEVHWQGGGVKRQEHGGPNRQLAVKLRTSNPSYQEDQQPQTGKAKGFKNLANTLISQRISASNSSLMSGSYLQGPTTKSDKDMRSIKSLDFGTWNSGKRRQRALTSQTFPTAIPEGTAARTSSHNDMATLMEASGEQTQKDWNPMNASWLPPTMTTTPVPRPVKTQGTKHQYTQTGVSTSLPGTPKIAESGASTPVHLPVQTPEERKPVQKATPKGKKKFWQNIKAFFKIKSSSPEPAKQPVKSRPTGGSARSLSFGNTRSPSLEERENEIRKRASSPALPSSSFTPLERGNTLPTDQDASPPQDRPESSSGLPAQNMEPRTRPVSIAGPIANAPIQPISRDIIARQYRFGPDTPPSAPAEPSRASPAVDGQAETRRRASDRELAETPISSAPQRSTSLLSKARSNSRELAPKVDIAQRVNRPSLAGSWLRNFTEGTSGAKVDELLNVSSLQRLAREKTMEMEIVETADTVELKWHIPLNGSTSKISKVDKYLKNGEVVEGARRDGRAGVLRSQLTFTPEGHVHIRALQGAPYSAVFHDRIKLSSGGRRIKLEQKFQLLEPGVPPVKHYSIWNRVE